MNVPEHAVLLVEDNPGDAVLLLETLPPEEFHIDHVETLAAAMLAVKRKSYDLVLLDLGLPDATGTEGVDRIMREFPEIALVVLTGLSHDEVALRAVRCGAQDYLIKGKVEGEAMARSLRHAIARKEIDVHKSRFLATISHEMRTPLNFVLGFASCLEDEIGGPLTEQQHQFVHGIVEGTERLIGLVDDLLDSAQIMAGRLSLARAPAEFESVVSRAVSSVAPLALEKQIDLGIDHSVPATLEIDDRRIMQVITNLLSNAIKYTSSGGRIRVRTVTEGKWLRTEVTDTGIGIPESFQDRIFERFAQAPHPQKMMPKGTGLGLSISKAIIEAHSGEIGVTSTPDVGSTFWFSLPLALAVR